jgi:hypothetical protein
VWNVRDESVDWVAEISALTNPYQGDTPRHRSMEWRRPFDGRLFTDLEETVLPYAHVGPPGEIIVDRILSVSFIARQPEAERNRVERALRDLIERHPDLRGRETVSFPYHTHAYHARRR